MTSGATINIAGERGRQEYRHCTQYTSAAVSERATGFGWLLRTTTALPGVELQTEHTRTSFWAGQIVPGSVTLLTTALQRLHVVEPVLMADIWVSSTYDRCLLASNVLSSKDCIPRIGEVRYIFFDWVY